MRATIHPRGHLSVVRDNQQAYTIPALVEVEALTECLNAALAGLTIPATPTDMFAAVSAVAYSAGYDAAMKAVS